MNIQGTAALVTGGGSGLGEATARELARLGAKVAVLDLNLEQAERVARDIGGLGLACDVSDRNPAKLDSCLRFAAEQRRLDSLRRQPQVTAPHKSPSCGAATLCVRRE